MSQTLTSGRSSLQEITSRFCGVVSVVPWVSAIVFYNMGGWDTLAPSCGVWEDSGRNCRDDTCFKPLVAPPRSGLRMRNPRGGARYYVDERDPKFFQEQPFLPRPRANSSAKFGRDE